MKANPGGQVDGKSVVGRDVLIGSLWERLDQQSLLLTAERRIGKTTILKKMHAETPARFVAIYQDLEGLSTPEEFVEAVGLKLRDKFGAMGRIAYEGERLLDRFSGGEAQGVKLPAEKQKNWKTLLPGLIQKVSLAENQRLLFFWDELPLMLYNIKQKSGAGVAMDVLDVIRNLRQDLDVRMILTGSIGLHHVIEELKKGGYSNTPTNDLYAADVPPLDDADARELAMQLLEGEEISVEDRMGVAREIAETANCVPFYIHSLIVMLKSTGSVADLELVKKVAHECLYAATDPWNLQHYRQRLKNYYSEDEASLARAVLDTLSHENSLTQEELFNRVTSKVKIGDREVFKQVLRLLELDHYLTGSTESKYQFRSDVIKEWWRQSI